MPGVLRDHLVLTGMLANAPGSILAYSGASVALPANHTRVCRLRGALRAATAFRYGADGPGIAH